MLAFEYVIEAADILFLKDKTECTYLERQLVINIEYIYMCDVRRTKCSDCAFLAFEEIMLVTIYFVMSTRPGS